MANKVIVGAIAYSLIILSLTSITSTAIAKQSMTDHWDEKTPDESTPKKKTRIYVVVDKTRSIDKFEQRVKEIIGKITRALSDNKCSHYELAIGEMGISMSSMALLMTSIWWLESI